MLPIYYLSLSVTIAVLVMFPNIAMAESEWEIYKVTVDDGTTFKIPYKITNAEMINMRGVLGGINMEIKNDGNNAGKIEIVIPRNLAETPNSDEDGGLIVFVDGDEVIPEQVDYTPCYRTLSINFEQGSRKIDIAATYFSGPPPRAIISAVYISAERSELVEEDIAISGCTDLSLDDKEVILDMINPEGKIFKTITITPNIDGSFSTSLVVQDDLGIDGTYIAKATYAGQSITSSFIIPEFSGIVLIILATALSIVLVTRLTPTMTYKK